MSIFQPNLGQLFWAPSGQNFQTSPAFSVKNITVYTGWSSASLGMLCDRLGCQSASPSWDNSGARKIQSVLQLQDSLDFLGSFRKEFPEAGRMLQTYPLLVLMDWILYLAGEPCTSLWLSLPICVLRSHPCMKYIHIDIYQIVRPGPNPKLTY